MKHLARLAWIALLLALFAPEVARYRAERSLADANLRLQRALTGADRGAVALQSVGEAATLAASAANAMPGDPRAPLLQGIALILAGRGRDALVVLDAAVEAGERPELTINQGRARTLLGDPAGAHAAYLRTAWASPLAVESLPRAMRDALSIEVARLEGELRSGALSAVPGG